MKKMTLHRFHLIHNLHINLSGGWKKLQVAKNIKYKSPHLAAIFFMTIFTWTLAPSGSSTGSSDGSREKGPYPPWPVKTVIKRWPATYISCFLLPPPLRSFWIRYCSTFSTPSHAYSCITVLNTAQKMAGEDDYDDNIVTTPPPAQNT